MQGSELAFRDAFYKSNKYRDGRASFGRVEFELKTTASPICTHRYTDILSARLCSTSPTTVEMELKLLNEKRQISNLHVTLEDTTIPIVSGMFTSHEQFRVVSTEPQCSVLIRMFQGCIIPLNKFGSSPALGGSASAIDQELDALYRQIVRSPMAPNNLSILADGTASISGITSQMTTQLPVEVPVDMMDNKEVYNDYIASVRCATNPKEGRALFECLVVNTLLPQDRRPRDADRPMPTTIRELHKHIRTLCDEYKSILARWSALDVGELTQEFTSDINVMAKDVVRTEKNSPYIKPCLDLFKEMEEVSEEERASVIHSPSAEELTERTKASIIRKHLLPFFLKEVADKRVLKVFWDEAESARCSQLTNEGILKLLGEDDMRCLSVAYSSQIRMFSVLVGCFIQKPPIGYVQGMNDFVGSLTEQALLTLKEKRLFGMDIDSPIDIEGLVYFVFRKILKLHQKAFTTQPLNGAMKVLERFANMISDIRPPLFCAMQRTDFDSILLHLLNPYLLFFRREVESGSASLKLLCESLVSEIGYNYIFVLLLAYVDINVSPVLLGLISTKDGRPEPVLPKLSCQQKVKSIELHTLAKKYMEDPRTKSIILDYFGPYYKP